jgi:hypothetical protein
MAKLGLKKFLKSPDTDGTVITQDLVDALSTQKMTESYLDPFGRIYEQFDVSAVEAVFSPRRESTATEGSDTRDESATRAGSSTSASSSTSTSELPEDAKKAAQNKAAADAYVKIAEALTGLSEEEEDVIAAVKEHIKTKKDWDDLSTLWKASNFTDSNMRTAVKDNWSNIESVEEKIDYIRRYSNHKNVTDPITLPTAIIRLFNAEQLDDLRKVLPSGVTIG